MYYTTSGAYRKTKMVIDYTNIVLTILIGIMFLLILFFRGRSGKLFPAEFLAGGLMNGLSATEAFMEKHRISGFVLSVVAVFLLVMAIISWRVVTL